MKATTLFPLALLTVASLGFAKNYALVIGGTSADAQKVSHEFARPVACAAMGLKARDYEVTTLFGSQGKRQQDSKLDALLKKRLEAKGVTSKPAALETEKYHSDYAFIKEEVKAKGATTDKKIDQYFENLIAKIKPGDKVEIPVFAHGHSRCTKKEFELNQGDWKYGPSQDGAENCHHEIDIEDENGKYIKYNTDKLLGYVKELEERGAFTNVVLDSCFSGRTKNKAQGLKNSCVLTLSSGDSPGYGCFEDDEESSKDYTSTVEVAAMRYCLPQFEELSKKPFFSNNKCFIKIKKHIDKHKDTLDFTSLHSIYWSARRWDEALHEPALNTSLQFRYFAQGNYSASMFHREQQARTSAALSGINELAGQYAGDSEVLYLKKALQNAFDAYNQSLQDQKLALESIKGIGRVITDAEAKNIAYLQQRTKELAPEVVKRERVLIDYLRKLGAEMVGAENKTACMREL